MNRELTAALMPNGIMQLEWIDSDTKPDAKADKGRQVLEKEIYRRFQEDIYSALLFLGLSDREIPLSVSLEFWRNFTGIFAVKLRQVQDIEQIREKSIFPWRAKRLKKY
ncbi:hypothetical protein M1N62_03500 [Thermodesulfovibrionales bacterium]|nr:hypothetical protein [Thermodesulfovibrionales bacterium]